MNNLINIFTVNDKNTLYPNFPDELKEKVLSGVVSEDDVIDLFSTSLDDTLCFKKQVSFKDLLDDYVLKDEVKKHDNILPDVLVPDNIPQVVSGAKMLDFVVLDENRVWGLFRYVSFLYDVDNDEEIFEEDYYYFSVIVKV
jgi:hypothetical protein